MTDNNRPTPTDRIIRHDGRLYLVRNGEVFVRLRKWWSGGAVEPADRAAVLDLANKGD